jgi:hypothetical protein
MPVKPRRLVPLGVAAILFATAAPAVADPIIDPGPVGANQFFTALVNDRSGQSRIAVNCDGPTDVVPTGHPVAGQTVEAIQTSAIVGPSDGFTGTAARALDVSFGRSGSPAFDVQLRFFRQRLPIPTTLVVPCSGPGIVRFVPDPTSPTARSAAVKVTFVSPLVGLATGGAGGGPEGPPHPNV